MKLRGTQARELRKKRNNAESDASVRDRCFADKGENKCTILDFGENIPRNCEGCKFYKTKKKFDADIVRAKQLYEEHTSDIRGGRR